MIRLDFLPTETALQGLRAEFVAKSPLIPSMGRSLIDDVSRDLLAMAFKTLNQAYGVQALAPGQVPHK